MTNIMMNQASMLDHLDSEAALPALRQDSMADTHRQLMLVTGQVNGLRMDIARDMDFVSDPQSRERLSEAYEQLRQAALALESATEGIGAARE